ncbi:hypothetical protein OD91_0795 [Lutibacter sp. Hel_I_33_5]|uniref:hypothetical protein n=1 Tax=Lutibacter sp. Hel_I_33_5 TaxID=1566289 RepID=UPI0011A59080|nr:hypothetical protein [Lutibacter sp. Hel_I_33_5]TVZ55541.1 hypothetical protein OD91_0795 [Lutibacter sp. Hel_I_33_5]
MTKKKFAIIGLLISILGVLIYFLDSNDSNLLPDILKGKGLLIAIIGSSFSFFYSLYKKNKKGK